MSLVHEQTDPKVCDLIASDFEASTTARQDTVRAFERLGRRVCGQCNQHVEVMIDAWNELADQDAQVARQYRARAVELREQERQTDEYHRQ